MAQLDLLPKIQEIEKRWSGDEEELIFQMGINLAHEAFDDIQTLLKEIKRLWKINELADKLSYQVLIDLTSIMGTHATMMEKIHTDIGSIGHTLMQTCVDPDEREPYESLIEYNRRMGFPDDKPEPWEKE